MIVWRRQRLGLGLLSWIFLLLAVEAQEPNGAKTQGEDENHHARDHNVRRRRLHEFSTDPKSVALKQTSTTVAATAAEAAARFIPAPHTDVPDTVVGDAPASLSILSLGGSVTWGATLEDRFKAYPWLVGHALGGAHVDNLAMRATGADFPVICIESQINDLASFDERKYDLVSFEQLTFWVLVIEKERGSASQPRGLVLCVYDEHNRYQPALSYPPLLFLFCVHWPTDTVGF
jgi:hypothetical protein